MSEDAGSERKVPDSDLYAELSAEINPTFTDVRGGVSLEYHTGEQIVSKLNETLGFMAWSFRVIEHGLHAEADEFWVQGELTVTVDGRTVTRQQFGSQKVKRSRSSGTPLDIGFDLKGATTDCLKKCASLIGVGLYLWAKAPPAERATTPGNVPAGSGPRPMPSSGSGDLNALICEQCSEPLTETRFKDGESWGPAQLATFGRRKHSRVLCMTHYREANQALRRNEEGAAF